MPLGPLVSNITAESILDKDSNLYHEGNYRAGLVSLAQPFSKEMYGDYLLIESLSQQFPGPFDVDFDIAKEFSSSQLEAFCRIVLVTYKNYVENDWYCQHSYSLNRAFRAIQTSASWGMYELDGVEEHYPNDKIDRLRVAIQFVQSALEILSAKSDLKLDTFPVRSDVSSQMSVIDPIAKIMLELLHAAAVVRGPWGTAWTVQHNTAWSTVFYGDYRQEVIDAFRTKLFREITDEVSKLDRGVNYRSAHLLGMILNVLGLTAAEQGTFGAEQRSITLTLLAWTKTNYLRLVAQTPTLAEHCLSGGVTFDAENSRLIKTYAHMPDREPARQFLDLDAYEPPAQAEDEVS